MGISLNDVQRGYDRWAAKPHHAKWVRKIDGTPIPNDIVVNIFEALKDRPSETAVEVKALEWKKAALDHRQSHGLVIAIAATPFGCYRIVKGTLGFFEAWFEAVEIPGIVEQRDIAIAAAQADYDRRIISALTLKDDPGNGGEDKDRRIAELEAALRDKFCPRPCNHRPDEFGVGDCVDAGECGCGALHALIPEQKEG